MHKVTGDERVESNLEAYRDEDSGDESSDWTDDKEEEDYDSDELDVIEDLMGQMKEEMQANQQLKTEMMRYFQQKKLSQSTKPNAPDHSQHQLVASIMAGRNKNTQAGELDLMTLLNVSRKKRKRAQEDSP